MYAEALLQLRLDHLEEERTLDHEDHGEEEHHVDDHAAHLAEGRRQHEADDVRRADNGENERENIGQVGAHGVATKDTTDHAGRGDEGHEADAADDERVDRAQDHAEDEGADESENALHISSPSLGNQKRKREKKIRINFASYAYLQPLQQKLYTTNAF